MPRLFQVIALFLSLSVQQASACYINFMYSSQQGREVTSFLINSDPVVSQRGKNICNLLSRNDAKIYVSVAATVLGGKSIAVVNMYLADTNSNLITGSFSHYSMKVNDIASMDVAMEIANSAAADAFNGMNFEEAVKVLREERQLLRSPKR